MNSEFRHIEFENKTPEWKPTKNEKKDDYYTSSIKYLPKGLILLMYTKYPFNLPNETKKSDLK